MKKYTSSKNIKGTIMKFVQLLLFTLLFSSQCFAQNEHLKKVLLIINYNHPHYESIPLLKKIYGEYFNNIIFYGPREHPDIHLYHHHMGYLSYMCIADAMQRYPDFEGYLFLMDDCILNAWLLEDYDTSKIWYSSYEFVNNNFTGTSVDIKEGLRASQWQWWTTKWGCKPMTKAFYKIPDRYKIILEQNSGPSHVVVAFSDVVYIPANYKDQFIELAPIFGNHDAFLETALPTIVNCLSSKSEWLWLNVNNTYTRALQDFKLEFHCNHPIKLSKAQNRDFVEKLFEQYL